MQTALETIEAGVDQQRLRTHLARILSSPQFAGSPKLAKFLVFVVDTVLAGQGDQIKESLIAVEVYGRPADYNPQIDSTVRVEAGRLRARLRQFYETTGVDHQIEIELPKGTYAPVFHTRSTINTPPQPPEAPEPAPALPSHRIAFLALLISVAVAAGLLRYLDGATVNASTDVGTDAKTMEVYLRAYELLRIPVLKDGVIAAVPETVFESVRLFEEVTQRDPRFSKGWVGLAEANEWLYEIDKSRPPERLIAAKTAALRAIDLDANLPEAWTILSSVLFFREWNIPAAERACLRAIKLNPRDTLARDRYVNLLRIQGRLEEAQREVTLAAGLQPSAPNLRNDKALLLLDTGQLEEAIEEGMAAEALNPSKRQMAYTISLWIQASAHQRQGRMRQAEALYRKGIKAQPHDRWCEPSLGHLLAVSGRESEAIEILNELKRQLALGRPQHKALALVSIGLGRHEDAIAWLERGFIERDCAILLTALDWRFAPLHPDRRFQDLLARIRRMSLPATATLKTDGIRSDYAKSPFARFAGPV